MAKIKQEEKSFKTTFIGLLKKLLVFLSGTRPFVGYVAEILENHAERVQKRMLALMVTYLIMAAGIIFLILGVLFLIIDIAGVARGVVFSAAGLIIVMTTFVCLQIKRK